MFCQHMEYGCSFYCNMILKKKKKKEEEEEEEKINI